MNSNKIMTVRQRLKHLHRELSTTLFCAVVVSVTAIFVYSRLFKSFNIDYFCFVTISVMALLWLAFHGFKHLLRPKRINLAIERIRQQLHHKGAAVILALVVLFAVIMHLTGCSHTPKQASQTMIEAKPILIAQQTKVNEATNYVYALKGFYQHENHEISGTTPESSTTTESF